MNNINDFLDEFIKKLNIVGVEDGDILYVSSDITRMLYKISESYNIISKKDRFVFLNAFVNSLQRTVGEQGTLLFPVFTWSFCRGDGFDYRTTKGEVGALANWVLKNRDDFVRTQHPMYSFMVWGQYSSLLMNMCNQDAWGEASPFTFLRNHGAKQLLFDIEAYQGLTFGHYVEQCVDVPYRHIKYFFGDYTDMNGHTEKRMYSMFVRDIDVHQEIAVKNDFLISNGVALGTVWDDNQLTLVDLQKAYETLAYDMKHNFGNNTLKFTNYTLDWNIKRKIPYEIGGLTE